MPFCHRRGKPIFPGAALDRVISQGSSDDSVLYKLADYLKGGRLLEEYARGGGREVERLIMEEFGVFMYNSGRGMEVTRTEFLKWKFRNVPKEQLLAHSDPRSPFDPLRKWNDHEACWKMQYRGTLGETLLHVLIMCDTKAHTRVSKILLKCFPKLALDVVEGEEYLGASALHLAIAYHNNDLVTILVKCGANIHQRAIGSFFLPTDQQVQRPKGPRFTDYEGLAYLGELPLAWAACLGNETVYNRLIDCGADPNLQDSFGNMILHMVVVCNQLGMFSYSLRHPRTPAQDGIVNAAGLTPLTLACKLARSTIFKEMLELTCIEFWRYSNVSCSAYPLNALDTIRPNGETNWNSALMIILNGTKAEHLDMLEGGIIQRLLEEKWKTFAKNQFQKRLVIMLLQLIALSVSIYTRPCYCLPPGVTINSPAMYVHLHTDFFRVDTLGIVRYTFEGLTVLGVLWYSFIQQGEEIKNQGLKSFLKGLAGDAPKLIFLLSNFLIMVCIPCRIAYFYAPDMEPSARVTEDELLAYACVGFWFMMMFFAGALKLTGPFVVMIYKMISGDMFTFSIIYGIMLMGFTQAFYFLYKRSAVPDSNSKFVTYATTWMALFHMTLGDYDYQAMSQNIYVSLTKFVFLVFTIMLPIMLLNMLIAMMGNTYSTVISNAEKEWVKAWAKIVISLERAVPKNKAKDFLYKYSVPLGGGGEDEGEEDLGVMVIKCKDKTKAKQRKGALSNWKRVGKVTIKELKRRRVTGETLRREMWGLCSAQSTPLHGIKKKGGAGAYNVTAGVSNNLDDILYGEDEDSDFDADANDGFGALTGAIDQLAFTNDLDFSGDGVDDDDPLKPMRPEQMTALSNRKDFAPGNNKKKKKKNGYDNQAFLTDEDILLAAAVAATVDEESDDEKAKKSKKVQKNNTSNANIPAGPATLNQYGHQTTVNQPYNPSHGQPTFGQHAHGQPVHGQPYNQPHSSQVYQQPHAGAPNSRAGMQNGGPIQSYSVPQGQYGAPIGQPIPHQGAQPGYGPPTNPQGQMNQHPNQHYGNTMQPGGPGMAPPTGPQIPQGKLPPIISAKKSRPISARVRRLGSAQKQKPNFDKTFKHLQPVPLSKTFDVSKGGASVSMKIGLPGIPTGAKPPPEALTCAEPPAPPSPTTATKDTAKAKAERQQSRTSDHSQASVKTQRRTSVGSQQISSESQGSKKGSTEEVPVQEESSKDETTSDKKGKKKNRVSPHESHEIDSKPADENA